MTSTPTPIRTPTGASIRVARADAHGLLTGTVTLNRVLSRTMTYATATSPALTRLLEITPTAVDRAVETALAARRLLLRRVRDAAAALAAALLLLDLDPLLIALVESDAAEALDARQAHDEETPRRITGARSTAPVRGPSARAAA